MLFHNTNNEDFAHLIQGIDLQKIKKQQTYNLLIINTLLPKQF